MDWLMEVKRWVIWYKGRKEMCILRLEDRLSVEGGKKSNSDVRCNLCERVVLASVATACAKT